jgi:predicted ABC-type ATPase
MLEQMDALATAEQDFMFETTLSSFGYARRITAWRLAGYFISLVYLRLPSVSDSISRVERRVSRGGHDIPEHVIRRRFDRSLRNLERYKPLVNEWFVYDSLEAQFVIVDASDA